MGRIFSNIVSFLSQRFWLLLLLLIALTGVFYLGIKNIRFEEDIYAIFPEDEKFAKFNKVLKENNLNKQIIFSINAEGKDSDSIFFELDSVSSWVIRETKGLVTNFEVFREGQDALILKHVYNHLPAFLDTSDYQKIANKLQDDSIQNAIGAIDDRLQSFNTLFLRPIVSKDPLGIAWPVLNSLKPRDDSTALFVKDGILYTPEEKAALFLAHLDFELNESEKNTVLNEKLKDLKKRIKQQGFDFDYFGTFQISYENSVQVKEDTFITLMISLGLTLLLLILYYKSVLIPLFFVVPAVFSGFGGLGLIGFIQPNISAISVATAAVLMGIVLDYTFHFFTHFKHTGNITQSVRELSFPMLVGSFTTVVAFAALIFTDSVVLQNFGLIAVFTLLLAALFTLLLLPVLLKFMGYSLKKGNLKVRKDNIPHWVLRVGMYGILIATVVFLFKGQGATFDSDLNNLSYHSEELLQKEEYFTGINPKNEKKLHLFVSAASKESLEERNFQLYESLTKFKSEHGLDEIVSIAPYQVPTQKVIEKSKLWHSFWAPRIDTIMHSINNAGTAHNFSSTAFLPFRNMVHTLSEVDTSEEAPIIEDLGLSQLQYKTEDGFTAITSIVLDRSDLSLLHETLSDIEGVYVFDISQMANELMKTVKDDFNYLLIFSSLLVLFSLLVVYGRIELALFAFLPMVIAWIWILGIASQFNIEFNFINIIVATFIFGLGDDFSIFVTDGLMQRYKTNSNALSSYKSAIALSALTTVIGTGALYFAKHPAIHSIAVISVVGIACIVLVTLVIQPAIFGFFVTNRTKNKRSPMTLLGFLMSIFLFGYFFIGCMLLNILLIPVILLPIPKKKKRSWLNSVVSKLAKSTIYLGVHVKKQIIHPERLDFTKPSIIVANHSSFLDILLMIMLNPKVIIMVKKWVYYSPVFGFFIRYSGYLFIAEGAESNVSLVKERVNEGYSVMIFPEGTRSLDGKMKRFHKGAFFLAKELQLDIQPILIIGAHYVNPKNDLIIKSGALILSVMERISFSDELYQQRLGLMAKEVQSRMRIAMREAKQDIEDAHYLTNRVQYNYLYKGPQLEWYVRVKWHLEKLNYAFYDKIIGGRKQIIDFGCGMGYLGYFLHYRNEDRLITGVDYDAEKIAIAQNGHDKGDKLQFEVGDIRNYPIHGADVVFFNDVLHYLDHEAQLKVLNRAVDGLNDGGIIIVRDGITDRPDRHERTEKSEHYSTRVFGFNKISGDLSFFSSNEIHKFAKARKLTCEMIEQSTKTSNVLFLLRKNHEEPRQSI